MNGTGTQRDARLAALAGWIGAVAIALLGVALVRLGPESRLARASFDVPTMVHAALWPAAAPTNLVLVYLDEDSRAKLGVEAGGRLARRHWADLHDRLTQAGARLVAYDVDFHEPDPVDDPRLAESFRRGGNALLCGVAERSRRGQLVLYSLQGPVPLLRTNALGWGHVELDSPVTRRVPQDLEGAPYLVNRMREILGSEELHHESERWLSFYAPASFRSTEREFFPTHTLVEALGEARLPDEVFRGKVVFVGARASSGVVGQTYDVFDNPWARWRGRAPSPGLEMHATAFLNLERGDCLRRVPTGWQAAFAFAWGLGLGVVLLRWSPARAGAGALLAVLALLVGACWLNAQHRWWWNWMVPAAVQAPVGVVWTLGWRYGLESRRRRELRRAFAAYLSPVMADRIADRQFSLELGGEEVEATVMFTDLEGFTALSESLSPAEVSHILTTYFDHTTGTILTEEGTIIKYVGDAVIAVWGAPLPEPRHAQRAVRAAWAMSQASLDEIAGRRLRTRIGVNTGRMLAGNLGSRFRFDYTLIGDTVNFASRLEGLNKQLGTALLIGEPTARQLDDTIRVRALGSFRVVGKQTPRDIFEVLGPRAPGEAEPGWLVGFGEAVARARAGDWDAAEAGFRAVIAARGGTDGPSAFHLRHLPALRAAAGPGKGWDGVFTIGEK